MYLLAVYLVMRVYCVLLLKHVKHVQVTISLMFAIHIAPRTKVQTARSAL